MKTPLASLFASVSLLALALAGCAQTPAAPPAVQSPPATQPVAAGAWYDWAMTPWGPMLRQTGPRPAWRDYQMSRTLAPADKQRTLQMALPMMGNMMQLDAREAMNWFAVKYPAAPGVSFEQAVESLKLAANAQNLKYVGSNLLWKDFQAVLGDTSAPRVEVHSFCDIAVARELLKYIPEMVVFLPCRIAVMEDADKQVWLLTLDWDMTWLDFAGSGRGVPPELRQSARDIQQKLLAAMKAGAAGEL